MHSARQKLLSTLAYKSFRLGEFKLSSGGTSDYYIDCRTTTLDAKGSRLIGEVFLEEIGRRGWKPRAIGGLTMGADPIVVAVSVVSGEVDGFLVRKSLGSMTPHSVAATMSQCSNAEANWLRFSGLWRSQWSS